MLGVAVLLRLADWLAEGVSDGVRVCEADKVGLLVKVCDRVAV